MNLQEALEISKAHDELKTDYVAPATATYFDDQNCNLIVPYSLLNGATPLTMTPWALRQVCERLGPPTLSYMQDCPTWLRATNLNHWREGYEPGKQWLVRAYEDKARAVLSDQYVPISNTEILEAANEFVGNGGVRLIRPVVTPDLLHLYIYMRDVGDGNDYGGGVYLGNGEIGNRKIRMAPFVQRNSCTNSIVWQEGGWNHQHRWITIQELRAVIKGRLGQLFGVATKLYQRIMKAAEEEIEDPLAVIDKIAKAQGWSAEVKQNVIYGTEGKGTRMGIVNGISQAAHVSGQSDDWRVNMESLAGAILASNDSIFAVAAKKYQEAEVLG